MYVFVPHGTSVIDLVMDQMHLALQEMRVKAMMFYSYAIVIRTMTEL